jgi:predicted choloylglycine hydrolase
MRSRLFVHATLALIWSIASLAPLDAGEPFRFPESRFGKGELKYHKCVPVLVVEGTPQEIGKQVANLALKPAERLLNYPKDVLSYLATPVGMKALWPIVVQRGKRLLENFPADYRAEFETMAAVVHEREMLMAANTMFDLKQDLAALFGCSALLVEANRSATGKPFFGRNMDHFSLGYLHEYSLVTVYRPRGKHAFASVGYAGLIGCISGINDAGLSIAVLETTGAPPDEGPIFNRAGTPFSLCYRRLLEECTNVQEAEALLRTMNRTTTNNLVVCDPSGSAVLEITPSRVVLRRPLNGIGICTNHFCSPRLKLAKPRNSFTTLDRYATLEKVRQGNSKLDVNDVQQHLDKVHQGMMTLQTMIFEPTTLTLHLAVAQGQTPASSRTLVHLQLAPLFKTQLARP